MARCNVLRLSPLLFYLPLHFLSRSFSFSSSLLLSHRNASGPLRRFTISNYNDYADLLRGELLFLLAGCPASGKDGRRRKEDTKLEKRAWRIRPEEWIPPIRARILNPAGEQRIRPGVDRAARFDSPRAIYSKRSRSLLSLLATRFPSNLASFHSTTSQSSILDISRASFQWNQPRESRNSRIEPRERCLFAYSETRAKCSVGMNALRVKIYYKMFPRLHFTSENDDTAEERTVTKIYIIYAGIESSLGRVQRFQRNCLITHRRSSAAI